jgi:4-amino-4-deoxy-L-arabinose transferase-like glycosyltransferase
MTCPWFRQPTFWAVLGLAFAAYGLRLTLLPVFGEETRRGVIAREMLDTDDWIVPRVQGVPRMSRPPLQNWLIALASGLSGSVDVWAVRLPSIVATLLTVTLVYAATHRWAGVRPATLAACAYATMYQVLEFGRLGETEAVFTLLVSSSLILWYAGYVGDANRWRLWIVSYLLVAAGMLTKGLQAPVYFGGAVGLTLIAQRRWRELLSPAHLVGVAIGGIIVGSWQVAFMLRLGWREGWEIYFLNVAGRFDGSTGDTFLGHFVAFPFETAAVMLPGSLILLALLRSDVRERLGPHRELIRFLLVSAAWAYLFVWIPPGARTRYLMPVMPLAAVLIGLVGDAWLTVARPAWSPRQAYGRILGTAGVIAAIYVGPVLSYLASRCDDIDGQVTQLRSELPPQAKVVSFGQLHHGFLFYFRDPIRIADCPTDTGDFEEADFFAIHTYRREPPPLPFEWELVEMVSCDRFRKGEPRDRIYVGRRLDAPQTAQSQSDFNAR